MVMPWPNRVVPVPSNLISRTGWKRSKPVTVNVAGEPVAFEIDQPDDRETGAFVDAGLEFRRPMIVRDRGGTLSGVAAVEMAGSRFKDDDFNEDAIGRDLRLQ